MGTLVGMTTIPVSTVNVALVAPAGIVTLAGTAAAAGLLLESVTCAPPAGAGPFSVTVPAEFWTAPTTALLITRGEASTAGSTVSAGVRVPPPEDAVLV